MSLINEALKKAQRQRTLDAAPLSSAPSGVAAAAVTTHVSVASRRGKRSPLWFGLGLLALGVAGTVLVMRYGIDAAPSPSAPQAAATPTPPPAPLAVPGANVAANAIPSAPLPAPAPPRPAPVAAVAPATSSAAAGAAELERPRIVVPSFTAPPPAAAPTPASVASETLLETPAAAVAPVVTAPTAAPPTLVAPTPDALTPVVIAPITVAPVAAPSTTAEREARVYAFLDSVRITGVRGLDAQARVLMNEKVYRLNDIVDPALGLRLSAVRPGLMIFTDAQGTRYRKPY